MDIFIILLILFLYWELIGIFCYAWTYIRAWIDRYDISSNELVNTGQFLKSCLVLGPLMIIIFILVEIECLRIWFRKRKQ